MDENNTSIIFFIIISTLTLIIFVGLVINLLLLSRNKNLKHQSKINELNASFEKEVLLTKYEIKGHTQDQIANDLHNDVGQILTSALIQINLSKMKHPRNDIYLDEAYKQVSESLNIVRDFSKLLSSEFIETIGLKAMLDRLIESVSKNEIEILFRFDGKTVEAVHSLDLILYRIIQEFLTNTLKHAKASVVQIVVVFTIKEVIISYSDNGIWKMEDNYLKEDSGIGLKSIKKRIELLRGNFFVETNIPHGFKSVISLPLIPA